MYKKFCTAILTLIFTVILFAQSFAYTPLYKPNWDGGLIVQPFWQTEKDLYYVGDGYGWAKDKYANIDGKEFKDHGCAVTAMAMLLRYYGMYWIPDNDKRPDSQNILTPGSLNEWLYENNGGYKYNKDNTGASISWEYVIKNFRYKSHPYGWNKYIFQESSCWPISNNNNCPQLSFTNSTTEKLLEKDLIYGMPQIAKIRWHDYIRNKDHPEHFMVVSGFDKNTNSWRANDPQRDYKTLPPDGLNTLYPEKTSAGDDAYTYNMLRLDRYSPMISRLDPFLSYIVINIYSPVEIQVLDREGKTTGYDLGTHERSTNIPRSMYYEDGMPEDSTFEPIKTLVIDQPGSGNFMLKIIATGEGSYKIDIKGYDINGNSNLAQTLTGTASLDMPVLTYRIKYSPTGESTMSTDNQLPIANAGMSQRIILSNDLVVNLTGEGSSDPDGDPLKYSWSIISKPNGSNASLNNSNTINPTFTPDVPGLYTVQLIVNDHFADSIPNIKFGFWIANCGFEKIPNDNLQKPVVFI